MGSGYRKLWTTPDRLRGARPTHVRGGPHARSAGRLDAEHRPRPEGRGRPELHLQDQRQGPQRASCPPSGRTPFPPGCSRTRPPRTTPASASWCLPLAEAAGVLHTTPRYVFMPDDPGARRVPQDLRRPAGHDRGVPAARSRTARRASQAPPRSSPRGSCGSVYRAGQARVDERALAARAALRPLDRRTGTATTSSGAGCGAARTQPSSRCPRTATRPSRASGACCSATARAHAPEVHGLEGPATRTSRAG